ncbi:MAG: copper homeostasis protein CutC [Angelakisella sp.]
MKNYTLECCVDSVESALAAEEGGATRLELCADLQLGGTTPGINLFRQVRRYCALPVNVLLRPRFGDFCYSSHELDIMTDDATMFAAEGANAVVIGVLRPDGTLNTAAMEQLIAAANNIRITLHRAFDVCADPFATLEMAAQLGVSSILTSGQQATALLGAALLATLHQQAGGRLEILAGSGINSRTIAPLAGVALTRAYHMSGKRTVESAMVYRKEGVPMGLPLLSEFELWRTDAAEVAAVRGVLERL